MFKNKKGIIKMVLAAIILVLIVFLFNPSLLFFLGEDAKTSVQNFINNNFPAFSNNDTAMKFGWETLVSLVIMFAIIFVVKSIALLILNNLKLKSRKAETVKGLFISVTSYLAVIIGAIWALSILGVNTAVIFASVGIVGLVIGFGAQSLIEDIITGVFIIFEGKVCVGDIVFIEGFRGVVESIGVRTTSIVDAGGNIKIINNSNIRDVHNLSSEKSMAVTDVSIAYGASIEKAEEVIKKACKEILLTYPDVFQVEPNYVGVQELAASSVNLRVAAEVSEANIYRAKRVLNRELKLALDRANIEIPFPQVVIHQAE